jgi:hypothetical protein
LGGLSLVLVPLKLKLEPQYYQYNTQYSNAGQSDWGREEVLVLEMEIEVIGD